MSPTRAPRGRRSAARIATLAAIAGSVLVACAPHVPLRPDEGAGSADTANPAAVQSRRSVPAEPSSPPSGVPQSPSSTASSSTASSSTAPSSAPAGSESSRAEAAAPAGPAPGASSGGAPDGGFQVSACAACHGPQGEGQASGYPALAGQGRRYLAKQLRDYRQGSRTNPIMQPIAAGLSEAAIDAAAAWYAAQPARAAPAASDATGKDPRTPPRSRGAPGIEADGAKLAQAGDARRQLVACDNCHGPLGNGLPPSVPRLAGQHAAYLRAQLLAWRQGTRRNDAAGAMAAVATALDDRDIAAVAHWYASRAPAPADPARQAAAP